MAKNPIGMDINPADPKVQALGAEMLKSGKVTPEEVQAAQMSSENPAQAKDWLSSFLNKQGAVDPYTLNPMSKMGEAPPAAMQAASTKAALPSLKGLPSGKSIQNKSESKQKTDTKNSQTRNLYADPEALSGRVGSLEDLPFLQDQKKGITDMENLLNMQMAQPAPENSDYWLRPLIALTDSTTGSNLGKGFKAQETAEERNAKLLGLKDDLQKRKGEYSKQLLEGLTKMKEGTETNSVSNQLATMMGVMAGSASQGRYGDPDDQRAFRAHQANLSALKKDVNLRQNLSNMQRIENGLNNSVGVEKLTNQSFHELQQAIRSSITKGSGGVDERAETYYKSLGMSANGFMQFLDSTPKNLSKNDPFVKHVLEIGKLELENIKRQNMNQAKMLTAGNRSIYEDPRYKHYQSDLDDALGTANTLYTPEISPKVDERLNAGKKTAKAAAPAQAEEDLSKMSNDQLKAYISAHGG